MSSTVDAEIVRVHRCGRVKHPAAFYVSCIKSETELGGKMHSMRTLRMSEIGTPTALV